ncbi:protein farnesyltransferase beta subunit, partial [Reticulomyxa filosa]
GIESIFNAKFYLFCFDNQIRLIDFLGVRCQHPTLGGFGGGPQQLPHLAASFGAVMALLTIGTKEAYECINREKFYQFLKRMKQPDGSFNIHDDGETDIRAVYCGFAAAHVLNILDKRVADDATAQWLKECQTYQDKGQQHNTTRIGGFSQEPYDEAHGGYAYCGASALLIMNRPEMINLDTLAVLFRDYSKYI